MSTQISDLAGTGCLGVATVSGSTPSTGGPLPAGRCSVHGGTGVGPIDAAEARLDAGTPFPVPGPGVESVARALLAWVSASAAVEGRPGAECSSGAVALLFTDLVGWTRLSTRLPRCQADAIRRQHFSTLAGPIAVTGGTEVKRLGDGIMATFSTATAALQCAVEMQRAVDLDNRSTAHPLGLRVGISAGDVTREGSDCYGDPVIEAARLCAFAAGGQVLAARVVKEMAGRHVSFAYRSVGQPELKGLADPVEVFEVGWEPLSARGPGANSAWQLDPVAGLPTGRPSVPSSPIAYSHCFH